MSSATLNLAPYYRLYELPWSPTQEVEQRFRKILRNLLIVFALFAIVIPFLPVQDRSERVAPAIPDRVVNLVLEKKAPPPPPPPPKVEPKEEPKPEAVKPEPKPQPQPKPEEAREKAKNTGLLKLQDQLADLRDNTIVEKAALTKNLTGAVGEQTRAERSLITSRVGASSGGINTASLSRGYGSGAGSLTGHETTQVASATLAKEANDGGARRTSDSTKAARSREEIELIFDRNKSAIYALYSRALRTNPELKGKLVLEMTIAPDGSVTNCLVLSSELNDADLERKLVARVKLFRFEARDVETITTTKPIDFFPA
ncbi:MAG: AgmX/PglI C-terminal domain-containing protein [Steroidobacteraceae bacterium]